MSDEPTPDALPHDNAQTHRRRPRYPGKNPRRFAEKYKELDPAHHAATVAKVLASGKTVAGTHRPILVAEILAVLAPKPGCVAVDCTLGYGGHAREILTRIVPRGRLLGLDADPIELPRTEARLRALGFGPEVFSTHPGNFAGVPRVLAAAGLAGADIIVADLGVSSMQIDDPARGFSVKLDGPLDMRMNPRRGRPASELLERISAEDLAAMLIDHADEPHATAIAPRMAGKRFATTTRLVEAIRAALPRFSVDDRDRSVRRVFQALRIAVNDELSALDAFLRVLPSCLNPGGRVAVLTFHSGEDRRVKQAFASGRRNGVFSAIAEEVIRAAPAERHDNPRSASAKLRWAKRGGTVSADVLLAS